MSSDKRSYPKFKNLSPLNQAMLDRLVVDPRNPTNAKSHIDPSVVSQVFRKTSQASSDLRNIFKIMPWMHLPREILISSIVSPGDMAEIVLNISNSLEGLSPSLSSKLDKALKDFFFDEVSLESKVYDWVDEAMVSVGAHPIMVIPEASLDKIISGDLQNTSFESIATYGNEYVDGWYRSKGILGVPLKTPTKMEYVSFESAVRSGQSNALDLHTIKYPIKDTKSNRIVNVNSGFVVTDNLAAFRKPFVDEIMTAKATTSSYGETAFESIKNKFFSDADIKKQFFRRPKSTKVERLEVIPITKAEANLELGHPLTYHLPSESVVPIIVPGDPSNHALYLVVADRNGYPVSYLNPLDYYQDIRGMMESSGGTGSGSGEVIRMAKQALGGQSQVNNDDIDRLTQLHSNIIESDIINRVRTGLTGGEVDFNMPTTVKRLMFSRALANKRTTLIVVPADYMIYMAYRYNEFGVGTSILEDGKDWLAQTAAVHVAQVLGSIQNAIPGKDINIEIDPDDGTPAETAAFMAQEALALQYREFPYAIGSAAGLTEQLQLSGFNINVSGNSRYPETKATVSARDSSHVEIDTSFKERLDNDIIKLFGLTTEMVSNVDQPDFATTAVNNSLMLLKRVMVAQSKTNPFLTDYVRLFTYNSGILLKRLIDIVEDNKRDIPKEYTNSLELIEDYINSTVCTLPKPQTDNLVKQAEALVEMSEAVDKYLDAYFKEEYLAGFNNPALEKAYPVLRESFKGMFMRKWMRDRGIFRDLDIFTTTDDGSMLASLNEEMANYTVVMRESIGDYYERVAGYVERKLASDQKLVKKVQDAEFKEAEEPDPEDGGNEQLDEYGMDAPPEDDDFEVDESDPDDTGEEIDDAGESESDDESEDEEDDDPLDEFDLDSPPT